MVACKHGMNPSWCSQCIPKVMPKRRDPVRRQTRTVFGSGALEATGVEGLGYAVIRTSVHRQRGAFLPIGPRTTFVHIDGHLFLWILEDIFRKAPNLKTIRIIPPMKRKLRESHRQLCAQHSVEIVTGYHWPERAWGAEENRSPHYRLQRAFFKNIDGEQKKLFDELLLLGFEAAQMAARYFCLNDEPFMPQHQVAAEFGYALVDTAVSAKINAVIRYLDPSFKTGEYARSMATNWTARVARLRELHSQLETRQRLAEKLGLEGLPEKLPLSRLHIYETLVRASHDGRLEQLKAADQRSYLALAHRFGLEDNVYRVLREVGDLLGGITRERVRQIETEGLEKLGITDTD